MSDLNRPLSNDSFLTEITGRDNEGNSKAIVSIVCLRMDDVEDITFTTTQAIVYYESSLSFGNNGAISLQFLRNNEYISSDYEQFKKVLKTYQNMTTNENEGDVPTIAVVIAPKDDCFNLLVVAEPCITIVDEMELVNLLFNEDSVAYVNIDDDSDAVIEKICDIIESDREKSR